MATTAITAPLGAAVRMDSPRPRYARPALILIVSVAGLLYAWDIQHSQYHPFYADAVRSMSGSWKAFLYGSFDPGSTITLDKLPGFLWPQALSARLFGFHAWALTLPQVVEGVLSVLVLHRAVRRWAGVEAGLIAAALFTLTPVVAGLFRTSVEDPAFTLLLLLAADATTRAARTAACRPLLLAGFWVGLAFQAKMLEAFAVLPALALAYLVAAPAPLRRRLLRLGCAGALTLVVSASWMLLITLTPAQDRPYVDGTTDNSAVSMVVGYNFLNRFAAVGVNAADTGSVSAVRGGPQSGRPESPARLVSAAQPGSTTTPVDGSPRPAGPAGGGEDGWGKLLAGPLASQTGWFYPLGLLSLGFGLYARRKAPRTDPLRAGLLLWGAWLGVFFLVLSAGSVGGHSYYMGVIAAPLAALGGFGLVQLWRAYRDGARGAWPLPVTVAVGAGWAALLARNYPHFLSPLAPAVLLLALVALLLLTVPLLLPLRSPNISAAGRAGLLLGVAALLLGPALWTATVLDPAYGHSGMGTVGPAARPQHRPQSGSPYGQYLAAGESPGRAAGLSWPQATGTLTPAQQALVAYTRAHQGRARYVFATTSWSLASPYILATDAAVLPIGGFTGQAPAPALGTLRREIADGTLRYVLLADRTSAGGPGRPSGRPGAGAGTTPNGAPKSGTDTGTDTVMSDPVDPAGGGTVAARTVLWISRSCSAVPPGDYGGGVTGAQLYRCGARTG
ncbi:ArnT family glycosyltransferase [Streptacidiphilus sp. EB129]|uniref:ArnT family glycosyltransferase n=1 Tax=Streptacidiphilus sp. EB129 TaxID=3156262 RepID=UPI003518A3A6